MGPSQLSFSSSSRSGRFPIGLQAWAKPTPWALWVRTGRGMVGSGAGVGLGRHLHLPPVLLPRHASSMCSFPLALGSPGRAGTRGNIGKLSCPTKGAEKHLSLLWNGVVSLETRQHQCLTRQCLLKASSVPGPWRRIKGLSVSWLLWEAWGGR